MVRTAGRHVESDTVFIFRHVLMDSHCYGRHIPTGSSILCQQLLPKCYAGQGRSSLVSRRPVAMTNRQSWTDLVRGVENGSNTWEGHVAAKSLQLLSGVWIDLCLNLGGQGRQTIMRLNRIQLQFKKN